ncbi:MAG: hypothetical protein FRX48_06564 [Lasallia pustulata]|uniref:Uncharacterized protein n=1 Tax=Lasallia pustulata TaxID=136370 RepID=A0A5M8PLR0_9LECA|nr:MAG: hypothetical protein FRX48_06564 [Lasallia pustulata]
MRLGRRYWDSKSRKLPGGGGCLKIQGLMRRHTPRLTTKDHQAASRGRDGTAGGQSKEISPQNGPQLFDRQPVQRQ